MGTVWQRGPNDWAARWTDPREPDQKRRRKYKDGFLTAGDANEFLAKVREGLANAAAGRPADPKTLPTISELVNGPTGTEGWTALGWMKARLGSHRAGADDESRWKNHVEPFCGAMKATQLDRNAITRFIDKKQTEISAKTGKPLNPQTVKHCVNLISTMFTDFVEYPQITGVTLNPCWTLSRKTRRKVKPTHKSKRVPFLETKEQVHAVYQAIRTGHTRTRKLPGLPVNERVAMAFAIGYYAFMRPGEILALDWPHIHLETGHSGQIDVEQQVSEVKRPDGHVYYGIGPVKDEEARPVPIPSMLATLLREYRLKTGGVGLLFPPEYPGRAAGRKGAPAQFMRLKTLHKYLAAALLQCRVPRASDGRLLTWYQCTKHTGASHWVKEGGSIEKLATWMGHSSTEVTKLYAHLRPEWYDAREAGLLDVDLRAPLGEVLPLAPNAPAAAQEAGANPGAYGTGMAQSLHSERKRGRKTPTS